MNIVILSGNLGADPELRTSQSGMAICNLRLATTNRDANKTTEWHRIVCFGKLAEVCAEHLDKGSQINLRGRIHYDSYEKGGLTTYTVEIIAETVDFIKTKSRHQVDVHSPHGRSIPKAGVDDRIPF